MIQDRPRPFAIALGAFFRGLARWTVRRGLRGVWVRGSLPEGALVLAPNHHSWWDTYVWPVLLWRERRTMVAPMLDYRLREFPIMRYVGIVPVSQPRKALQGLQQGATLLIFPEGELLPPGRLGALQPGSAWMAARAGCPLVPAVLRVAVRGEEFPEAYVWFGQPVAPDTQALEAALSQMLSRLDQELQDSDPEAPLPGFSLQIAGRRSTQERMAGVVAVFRTLSRGP